MALKILILSLLLLVNYSLCNKSHVEEQLLYRLPKHVIPSKYTIELEPHLEPHFNFTGSVIIEVNVIKTTKHITLHSYLLTFDLRHVIVAEEKGPDIKVNTVSFDKDYQFCEIYLEQELQPGKTYTITVTNFQGILREDMSGFYKSSYKAKDGKTRWLATTQFQPTHARSAFPCFDEPEFKATFDISIVHDASFTAVSNMPGHQEKPENGKIKTWFDTSVKMSTYLIAFIVSDFKSIETSVNPIKYRVYSAPHEIDQAKYALEMSPKVLKALEDFTKIPYKLTKLDQFAIPDFAAGAMENWGLVTYREMYLLYNKEESTTKSKEEILTIIAHELAHQWFGNLVTCDWWEHTWLNEGFATYFQHYIPSLIEPSWRLLDRYVVDVTQGILITDALATTRPMSHAVGSPSEVAGIFDGISYQKASSVIHMMINAFGMDNFAKGLNIYLTENAFSTSLPYKLFDGIASVKNVASHLPEGATVHDVFSSWSTQAGFPLVTVTRNYDDGSMTLTQERYFTVPPKEKDNTKWWIPISYTASNKTDATPDTRPSHWMNKNGDPLKIDAQRKDGWIIVNNQNSGYYRVNYDKQNWKLLTDVLKSKDYEKINVLNRAQILDDSLNLAKLGTVGYEVALDLLNYLEQETDYVPWAAAEADLKFLDRMLDSTEAYSNFKIFVLRLLNKVYNQVGFEEPADGKHIDVFNRINALSWACKLNHEDCIKKSHDRLAQVMKNPSESKIPPNLHNVIYCTALREGGEKEWEFLWNRYLNSELSSESTILLNALGCTHDKTLLRKYLEKTVQENSEIRDQDKMRAVYSVLKAGDVGMMAALDFIKDKFPLMIQKYKSFNALSNMIQTLGSQVSNEQQYKLMEEVLELHKDLFNDNMQQSAEIAKESMDDNKKWWTDNIKIVSEWLEKNAKGNSYQIKSNFCIVFLTSISLLAFKNWLTSSL